MALYRPLKAIKVALKLYNTLPLSQHVKIHKLPPQEVIDQGKDGLRGYAKENCEPTFCLVGASAMLPQEDGGVVDVNLLVWPYGTSNIHVVCLPGVYSF